MMKALKKNRLTLLNNLRNLFLQIADISLPKISTSRLLLENFMF